MFQRSRDGILLTTILIYNSHVQVALRGYCPVKDGVYSLVYLLLLLLKKVGSARLRESNVHAISSKIPTPQYQPIDGKKRREKRVDYI